MLGAVNMAAEVYPFLFDFAQIPQAEYLEPAAVG